MERSRNDPPGSAVGYIVTLVGAAGFVLGCFLPFLGADTRPGGEVSISLYRQLTGFAEDGAYRAGELMILFGGVTVVSVVAALGVARRGSRPWASRALVFVAATWAVQWIGYLLVYQAMKSSSPLGSLRAGYWCVLGGVVVVGLGAVLANVRIGGRAGEADRLSEDPET
jgi:hypothetical protein